MLIGARVFVLVVYLILGASFVAGTALLISEFGPENGLLFATHDSHLFLFFPTLGLVSLAAFYLPSCAFVDMYWRHVRFGKLRLLVGLFILAGVSFVVGTSIAESPYRSVWDLSPETLQADKSEPAGCGSAAKPCERIALLEGVANIARVSHERLGLKEFVRTCSTESLIEETAETARRRFCFASTPLGATPRLSTDAECCRAQERYKQTISKLYEAPEKRSRTGELLKLILPLKVFLLLVLLAIGALLAARHRGVARHYPDLIERIEVGVMAGALAMLFFPLMSQGFVQSADALFGSGQDAGFKPIVTFMSFCFGAWALMLLLFFFRRRDTEMEVAAKLAGVAVSAIAVVKYDLIVALAVRFLGSGAGDLSVLVLGIVALISIIVMTSSHVRRLIAGEKTGS